MVSSKATREIEEEVLAAESVSLVMAKIQMVAATTKKIVQTKATAKRWLEVLISLNGLQQLQ